MQLNNSSLPVIAGFLLNILLAVYLLYRDKSAFSLGQVFAVFCLLFMSGVPLLQYGCGAAPWGWQLADATRIKANTLISCCLLLQVWWFRPRQESAAIPAMVYPAGFLARYKTWGMAVFIVAATALILLNLPALFWRSQGTAWTANQALQLLSDKVLRGLVLYFTLLSIHLYRRGQVKQRQLLLVLLLALISNFPLAVPRYWAATFYLAILISAFGSSLSRRPYLFRHLLGLGILLVFPVLSLARYSWSYLSQHFRGPGAVFRLSFTSGDFDAYASFCNTIKFVEQQGTTAGKQLLTVLLFFVPRAWWPGKGIGSGALVNRLPSSDFTNFSSPLFAEGYINFGSAGTVLFLVFFGWLARRYDRYYRSGSGGFLWLFYPVALGMSFFILRGDLLSSFAYTCGIFVSGWCFHRFLLGRQA